MSKPGYLNSEQPCGNWVCPNKFQQNTWNHYFCSDACAGITKSTYKGGERCLNCDIPLVHNISIRSRKKKIYCTTFCRLFYRDLQKGMNRYTFRDMRQSEITKSIEDPSYQRCGLLLPRKVFKAPPNEFEAARRARLKASLHGRKSPHKIQNSMLRAEAFLERRRDRQMQKDLKKANRLNMADALDQMLWEERDIETSPGNDE